MSSLEERVGLLEDRLALIEVESSYARYFDSADGVAWAGLFVEDGIYQSRGASATDGGRFLQGRDALARFCSEASFDSLHLFHLPNLHIDGERAQSRVHFEAVAIVHEGDESFRRKLGYYDVAYARVDGRWLIKRRVTSLFAHLSTSTWSYPAAPGIEQKST